jgi:hypothetical protein
MTSTKIKIRLPDGSQQSFAGREAWALRQLIDAGSAGITTLTNPAPRLGHYIFKLRKAGLGISTNYEHHKGAFPGTHGRYRLETPVTVVGEDAR